MKRLDEITIADLMPDSISKDSEVSATSRAIDPQLKAISEAVNKPLILAAIDDLSEGVLEHLAVQYDVTAWNSAWPIETKQAVLKTAIADKRKMGTRGAVQRAIEAVAPIATITEWWQDTGGDMPPHTFEIDLLQEGSAVDAETQASVIAQVNEAKPVRSHFTFSVGQMLGGNVYFAGVLRSIAYARVRSAGISIEQMGIEAGILAAMRGMSIRRLLASSHMGEMPEPTPPDTHPSFIIVDEETGAIVHSVTDEGMEFAEVGHILMPDSAMIVCVELGVPVEEFWLGANGRASTSDVTLRAGNKQYLRGEDGQITTDAATIALYDQAPALAYIKADGNTYEAASGDYAFENERYPGSGEDLSLYTVDTGSTRSAWAALFEKREPAPSYLTAYFTNQGAAATNNTTGSAIMSLYSASGESLIWSSSKTYTLVDLQNISGESVPHNAADMLTGSAGYLIYYANENITAFKVLYTES